MGEVSIETGTEVDAAPPQATPKTIEAKNILINLRVCFMMLRSYTELSGFWTSIAEYDGGDGDFVPAQWAAGRPYGEAHPVVRAWGLC